MMPHSPLCFFLMNALIFFVVFFVFGTTAYLHGHRQLVCIIGRRLGQNEPKVGTIEALGEEVTLFKAQLAHGVHLAAIGGARRERQDGHIRELFLEHGQLLSSEKGEFWPGEGAAMRPASEREVLFKP
jgi:hypothetical protein